MNFTIKGQLPSLNEYTRACRTNHIVGAQMKKDAEQYISVFLRKCEPIKGSIYVKFIWYEPNNKRDPDNVVFAKKFILDALVSKGLIEGDGRKFIKGFSDTINTDTKNPRIEVEITQAQ